jgi:hypothetical protein
MIDAKQEDAHRKSANQKAKGKGQGAKELFGSKALSEFLKSSAILLPFDFICSLLIYPKT